MKRRYLLLVLALAVLLCAGCASRETTQTDPDEARYKVHEFHDGQRIYVDDSALKKGADLSEAQEKLMERTLLVEMERIFETYQHYTTFPEGMSPTQTGLRDEMDARYAVLYSKNDVPLVGAGSGNRFYVTFHEVSVKQDVAKVVCSYAIKPEEGEKTILQEKEVIFWELGEEEWLYTNIISSEGGIDEALLEAVAESTDPEAWRTRYAHNAFKRADYALDGKNYTDYEQWHARVEATNEQMGANKLEEEPAVDVKALAANIASTRTERGTYALMGTEKSRAHFAPEKLTLHFSMGFSEGKIAKRFNRSNMAQIRSLVEDINRTYYASLFSGEWRLVPREAFAGDGIYKEANARTLVEMFNHPNIGVNVNYDSFSASIDKVRVKGDWAMAVVSRSASVDYNLNRKPHYHEAVCEGYIFKKIDGKWRIENILFSGGAPTQAIHDLIGPNTGAKEWEEEFSFNAHRRAADITGAPNYSDLVKGDIASPQAVVLP